MGTLMTLGRALGRVGTEFREVGRWPGDQAFHVRVELVGLERSESQMLMGAVLSHEHVEEIAKHTLDDELARQRRCTLDVDVVRVSNVAAAASIVLDAVRGALVDTGFASKVESLKVESGGA